MIWFLLIELMAIIGFFAYDSFIGLEDNGSPNPNGLIFFMALIWPISIPLLILNSIFKYFDIVKNKRILKAHQLQELREKLERETKEAEQELEEEFNEGTNKNDSKSA